MKKTLWQNILIFIGVLFSFSHAQMSSDVTHDMLRILMDKMEDLSEKLDGLDNSQKALVEKMEGINESMNSFESSVKSSQNSAATDIKNKITEEATKMIKGCESQLESLNTTLVNLIIDKDAELKAGSLKGDISSLKEGGQSKLESLNTTLVGSNTDKGNQTRKLEELRPVDCQEVLHSGKRLSGVYRIYPADMPWGVSVYCDQQTEGGGWIVFLQRLQQTPQLDFVKPYADYARGFGEPGQEFWLGNEALHAITGRCKYVLRAEAVNTEGESRHATWGIFSVGSKDTQFTLTINEYHRSSTMGNGLSNEYSGYQSNQMKFSTYDKDNQNECSILYADRVGWWFNWCFGALPTAAVLGESDNPRGLSWLFWDKHSSGRFTYLSWIQLKIRAE